LNSRNYYGKITKNEENQAEYITTGIMTGETIIIFARKEESTGSNVLTSGRLRDII